MLFTKMLCMKMPYLIMPCMFDNAVYALIRRYLMVILFIYNIIIQGHILHCIEALTALKLSWYCTQLSAFVFCQPSGNFNLFVACQLVTFFLPILFTEIQSSGQDQDQGVRLVVSEFGIPVSDYSAGSARLTDNWPVAFVYHSDQLRQKSTLLFSFND